MNLGSVTPEEISKNVFDGSTWPERLPVCMVILKIWLVRPVKTLHGNCLTGVLESQIGLGSELILLLLIIILQDLTLDVVALDLMAPLLSYL